MSHHRRNEKAHRLMGFWVQRYKLIAKSMLLMTTELPGGDTRHIRTTINDALA